MKNNKTRRWASISQQKDFDLLKQKGLKLRKQGFFVVYRKNQLALTRFAMVFPKWTGSAVQRNRFKRWARVFIKSREELLGFDLLLGFEKKGKALYKNMNYEKFCSGFSAVLPQKAKKVKNS